MAWGNWLRGWGERVAMVTSNDGYIGGFSPAEEAYSPGGFPQDIEKSSKNGPSSRRKAGAGLLLNIIERQVLPKLAMRHPAQRKALCDATTIGALGESEDLAEMLLTGNSTEVGDVIRPFLANGVSPEKVFLQLLAPLAQTVGRYWEEDRWTFFDVTMALNALHRVLRDLDSSDWSVNSGRGAAAKSVYLASAPGEQHVFGLRMVESLFAHAGWQVTCDCAATESDIVRAVGQSHFDLVGFSIGRVDFLDPLRRAIDKTRRASRNRKLPVLLGGNVFQRFPGFAREFKNTVIASDGLDAVSKALSRVDGDVGEAVSP